MSFSNLLLRKAEALFPQQLSFCRPQKFILVYLRSLKNVSKTADIFLNGKKVASLELGAEPKAVDYQGKFYLVEEAEYPRIIRCSVGE